MTESEWHSDLLADLYWLELLICANEVEASKAYARYMVRRWWRLL